MALEYIQNISPLFAHCGFKYPLGAAAYYALLIENFPTTFKTINDQAKRIMVEQIKPNQLRAGRYELLQHGFLAQVIPMASKDIEFDREFFLPISPDLVWKANVKKLDKIIAEKELIHRYREIEKLELEYKEIFKKYGIGSETGSLTAFHSSKWLLYILVYNIPINQNLWMLLGSLGSFEPPYINYYRYMLEKGINTRIIYDKEDPDTEERINNIINLKKKYAQRIEVRSNPVSDETSRKFICDNMVIDGKKILSFGKNDLSYISTIYLQKDIIDRIKKSFHTEWENARIT